MTRERLEVDDLVPVTLAEQHQRHVFLDLAGLHHGEKFEQLIEGAETAGEKDHRLGEVSEPELAHEEVVKLERQLARDVRIAGLFMRQRDRKTDIDAARLGG